MHKLGILLSGNFQGICQQWECYYYQGIFREDVKTGNFNIRDIFRDYMLLLPNNVIIF